MSYFRRIIGARRSSAVLALCISYALAIQAVLASVGLGMSVVAPDPLGFSICSHVSGVDDQSQAAGRHGQDRKSAPECPFCYVAAQSIGHFATATGALSLSAHPGLLVSIISSQIIADIVLPEFRGTDGEARAPPQFSV
jgi:hypothetical protein